MSDCCTCGTDGLRQLFTYQSLQPTDNVSGDDEGHSLVENVMLSDTLLWKGNRNCCVIVESKVRFFHGKLISH